MSDNNARINPAVKTTTIGVRELRDINVYPLSIMEQGNLADTVSGTIAGFVEGLMKVETGGDMKSLARLENVEVIKFIINLIRDNMNRIVEITTDEKPEDFLGDCTNDQFIEFAELIFEMNYHGDFRKKLVGLIQNVLGALEEKVPEPKAKKKKKKKESKK